MGTHETLASAPDPRISSAAGEYRRSTLVYQVARTYGLPELEALAKKYMEHFGESFSIFDILRAVKGVFSKLPDDEVWLPRYIKTKLQRAFVSDETTFKRDELHCELGEEQIFHGAVMRIVVDIYSTLLLILATPWEFFHLRPPFVRHPREFSHTIYPVAIYRAKAGGPTTYDGVLEAECPVPAPRHSSWCSPRAPERTVSSLRKHR